MTTPSQNNPVDGETPKGPIAAAIESILCEGPYLTETQSDHLTRRLVNYFKSRPTASPSAFKQAEMGTDGAVNVGADYAVAFQTALELYARFGMYGNEAQIQEAYRIKKEIVATLAALTAERDHFGGLLDEQVKLSADLQGKCGDLMTDNDALQQKVEEMTKERDAARQHHKEEAVLALNKLISAETALATATRESERMTHDFQLQAEHDGQRCKELEGKLESLARQNEELNREREKTKELLANPVAVHVMVLRGTIALDSDYIRKSDTHGEYAELRRQLTAALSLVDRMREAKLDAVSRMVRIARGCLDYGGGYRSDEDMLSAFHGGIQTVINALEAAAKNDPSDTQVNALERIGSLTLPADQPKQEGERK